MPSSDLPRGITKEKSSLGGFVVKWKDEIIGWMHEAERGEWRAYRASTPPFEGRLIGRYPQYEAIEKIAAEAGWPGKPKVEG